MKVYLDHIEVNFEYQGHWVKVKVMCKKKRLFAYFKLLFRCMGLQVIKVKVTYQGQGHTSRSNHDYF